jgi:hypothetical protein
VLSWQIQSGVKMTSDTYEIRMPFSEAVVLRDKLISLLKHYGPETKDAQVHLSIKKMAGSKYD